MPFLALFTPLKIAFQHYFRFSPWIAIISIQEVNNTISNQSQLFFRLAKVFFDLFRQQKFKILSSATSTYVGKLEFNSIFGVFYIIFSLKSVYLMGLFSSVCPQVFLLFLVFDQWKLVIFVFQTHLDQKSERYKKEISGNNTERKATTATIYMGK